MVSGGRANFSLISLKNSKPEKKGLNAELSFLKSSALNQMG